MDVTPCMLMSPSSVAKNLPVGTLHFDMVIFDEASQIKVADAIGSLGRAKSAVVVGDSQQMPPSSMFASGASEDDDTESQEAVVASDQESILSEAVSANLERKMLTWHYRSQDESLISYSNQRYYQGELSTFPAPPLARP
ncbi:DEAD/DEAH box helicase, partial [Staphylococcus epidermidis]|uniref:DEAD/DEAH box helicase n=1 Tax=Staphylococcus epidermidis TaxID=1282 RepID=UPI003B01BA2D